jgi:hypothetical protein
MSDFDDIAEGMNDAILGTFGDACTYTPPGGVAFAVDLVLEKPMEGDPDYPGAFMRASGILADFTTAPATGGLVTVGSDSYVVFQVNEDGTGLVILSLKQR